MDETTDPTQLLESGPIAHRFIISYHSLRPNGLHCVLSTLSCSSLMEEEVYSLIAKLDHFQTV